MARTPYVQDSEMTRLLKITAASGELPVRNVALLRAIYGVGLTLHEVATIPLRAYLKPNGEVFEKSTVAAEIAYNGSERPLFWTSRTLVEAVDAYLTYRVEHRHRVTTRAGAYRGLDPSAPIFLTDAGEAYRMTERRTATGTISYSCDSLSQLFRKLHAQAGIDGASANSARRTCAIRMSKQGGDLKSIKTLLGLKTLRATRNLVDADPIKLGAIVARIF